MGRNKDREKEIDPEKIKSELLAEIEEYLNEQLERISTELSNRMSIFISSLIANMEKVLNEIPTVVGDSMSEMQTAYENMRKALNETIRRVNLIQNFINEHVIKSISDLREEVASIEKEIKVLNSKIERIQSQLKSQPRPQPAAQPQPKPQAQPQTQSKPQPKPQPKPQQAQPRPPLPPPPAAATQPQPQPQPKPQPQQQPKPKPQPAAQPQPKPAPAAQPAQGPEISKIAAILKPQPVDVPKPIEEEKLPEVEQAPISSPQDLRLALAVRLKQLFDSIKQEE